MAHFTRTCLFLVLLLLSFELVPIEGRSLRKSNKLPKAMTNSDVLSPRSGRRSRSLEDVDAFRPTTPGHSPGVGHSINN